MSVTLGICIKNSGKTIAEALTSTLLSDYPSYRSEILLVDGGSTDYTIEIALNILKDSRLRWKILDDERKGLAYARQLVVDSSRQKYIIWVDGDNVLTPLFIRNHIQFMESNPKVGAACAITRSKGKTLPAKLLGYAWLIPTLNALKKGKTPHIGMQGSITRRKAIEDAGGFDLSIKGAGEDVDLFIRMKLRGWEITANPKAIVHHYMRETWRSIFNEARWWAIGSYYIKQKYANTEFAWKKPEAIKMAEMLLGSIKLTMDTVRITRDTAGLLMPLYYIIRRAGYIAGYMEAWKASKKSRVH